MHGSAHRRSGARVGRWRSRRVGIGAAVLLFIELGMRPCAAQVGYDPTRSPYHDIPRGAVWAVSGGHLGGSRGDVGVGPASGVTGGVRWEPSFGAVGASLGLAYAGTTRFVVNPTDSVARRVSGPFNNRVLLADAGLQLVLTGRKTWRRLAPFVGAAVGIAVAPNLARDSSGYTFGTKLTLAPNAGVRWYPARRVSVRGDVRLVFWRLRYPLSYKNPGPDGSRVLDPAAPLDQWTAHPWITIGLGWIF